MGSFGFGRLRLLLSLLGMISAGGASLPNLGSEESGVCDFRGSLFEDGAESSDLAVGDDRIGSLCE